jgi:Spy/CpxP family protein refolding chaperone
MDVRMSKSWTRATGWRVAAAALALAAGTLIGANALAKPGFGGGPGCGGPGGGGPSVERLERKIERFGLPSEKQTAVYAILDQARTDDRARRTQMREAHQQMQTLLAQDKPDLAQVEAQADAIGTLQTAAQKAHLKTLISLRPYLTSEQWAELQPKHRMEDRASAAKPGHPS